MKYESHPSVPTSPGEGGHYVGRYRVFDDDDDPWAPITRNTRDSLRDPGSGAAGGAPSADPGDTSAALRGDPGKAVEVQAAASSDVLDLLNRSLAQSPERADLWMMRFETLKSLGLKGQFYAGLEQAWRDQLLRRKLDSAALRTMWDELAPRESLPPGVLLPKPAPQPATGPAASATPYRRFSDLALRVAGEELKSLTRAYVALRTRPTFPRDCARRLAPMLHRPTRLQHATELSRDFGNGVRVFLKREDLRRVSAELENAAAQAYLAAEFGKRTVITGNDVDEHSLALAQMALRFGLRCVVIFRDTDLGIKTELIEQLREYEAEVQSAPALQVESEDPREAALRLWVQQREHTHLALSLGTGPAPYPSMISDFRALLGHETGLQLRAHAGTERPRTFIAAVHSEADSIGFMLPQLANAGVELVFSEPDAKENGGWHPSARLAPYNGALREHAWLRASGRISYVTVGDRDAYVGQQRLLRLEGIQVNFEDARAIAVASLLSCRNVGPRDLVILTA